MPANNDKTMKKKRSPTNGFKKGRSGNPSGRPKLPKDIKELKRATGETAIKLLAEKVDNFAYLSEDDQRFYLREALDRCGHPKMSQQEVTGADGQPQQVVFRFADEEDVLPDDTD